MKARDSAFIKVKIFCKENTQGIITHFKRALEKIFHLARLECVLRLQSNLGALLQAHAERLGQKLKKNQRESFHCLIYFIKGRWKKSNQAAVNVDFWMVGSQLKQFAKLSYHCFIFKALSIHGRHGSCHDVILNTQITCLLWLQMCLSGERGFFIIIF